jgi:tetratricopeptide (TPR) repeat protein
MHMVPTARPESIQLRAGLYFADAPPHRPLATLRLGRQNIDIPAGATRYVVRDSYVLPVDLEVHSVQPHAHYLAKEIKAFAILPDGSLHWLISINNWDFEWQDVYRYRDPFWLPRGTVLHMEYSYDNSAGNRRNRNAPPKRVRFGQQTSDEMAFLWVQVLPRDRQELATLLRDYEPKERGEDIVGFRVMMEATPEDPDLRYSLASALVAVGRADEAIDHARESVRLQPASDVARYNLGTVLATSGHREEAARQFREAIRLNPTDASAHNSLGVLDLARGQAETALEEFLEAVRLDPLHAKARNNVGAALQHLGRIEDAIEAYQQATHVSAGDSAAHYNLGNALKVSGRMEAATSAYLRALAISPAHERAYFHLATAYESQAKYPEAVHSYRQALALRPDEPATLARLAWILATAPSAAVRNPGEAVELAERAIARQGGHEPSVLDTLAVAYAAVGRFDLAVANAERALAGLAGDQLASEVRDRLALYRARKAYRAPLPQ